MREKKLTPVRTERRGPKRTVTYHDPCYLGRHNQVYDAAARAADVIPDAEFTEMPRNSERSFCCGAGGARMWMEENIGERINVNRTKEAVETGADQIAVGCPFCRVMLSDGLTAQQSKGEAREEVEVLDVAQMLLASVKGENLRKAPASQAKAGAAAGRRRGHGDRHHRARGRRPSRTPGDATQTEETVTDTEDVGPRPRPPVAARSSTWARTTDADSGSVDDASDEDSRPQRPRRARGEVVGGSLFDLGDDDSEELLLRSRRPRTSPSPRRRQAEEPASSDEGFGGGSLFDLGDDDELRRRLSQGARHRR